MIKYYFERTYPYIVTFIVLICIKKRGITFVDDYNFDKALTAVITLDAIVIGFMGALMPIILSMKNESKFVKYVFEKDSNELFKKYLKITVITGILNAGITVFLYLENSFKSDYFVSIMEIIWVMSLILFLMLTLRSMEYMITLFFSKDESILFKNEEEIKINKEYEIDETKEHYSK